MGTISLQDFIVVQLREVFERLFPFLRIRNAEDEHPIGFEQPAHVLESSRNWRRDVLEDISCNYEVHRPFELCIDGAKIQFWLLMIIGIGIIELAGQAIGINFPVADAQPLNVAPNWKL